MTEKILEAFAENTLYAMPVKENRTPEYQKACDKAYSLVDELEGKLSREEKELLDKTLDAISAEQEICLKERLIRGFCLGVLMMMEVLERKDDYFPDE